VRTIEVRVFGHNVDTDLDEWDLDDELCQPDCHTARATALYDALNTDADDNRYSLAQSLGGDRWGVFGLIEPGELYAVEVGQ